MSPEEEFDLHDRFGELLHDFPGLDVMILEMERKRTAEMRKAALRRPFVTFGIRMTADDHRRHRAANDGDASEP